MERRDRRYVDHGAMGSMVTVKKVNEVVACAVVIGFLAIIGACVVVYQLIQILIPVLVFIDFVGR